MTAHVITLSQHPAGLNEAQVLDLITLTQDVFAAEFARAITPLVESINAVIAELLPRAEAEKLASHVVAQVPRTVMFHQAGPVNKTIQHDEAGRIVGILETPA